MIYVFALLCLVTPAAFGYDAMLPNKVLHMEGEEISFFEIPKSLAEVNKRNWVQRECPPNAQTFCNTDNVTLWTHEKGVRLGVYLNSSGIIVGVNIAINKAELTDVQTNMTWAGFADWKTIVNETAVELYSILTKYHCYKINGSYVCDKVEIPGVNGVSSVVSMDMSQNPDYTKQKCMDSRGIHRFYNMSSATDCSSLRPFFFLTDCDNKMIGFGFLIIARRIPVTHWNWNVRYGETEVSKMLSDYPACMTEHATSTGFEAFELWHIADPQGFSCSACA